MKSLIVAVLILLVTPIAEAKTKTKAAAKEASACGHSLNDWCSPSKKDDPCGEHKNVDDCKADPSCFGMKYLGTSMVACQLDERGFGKNCPTVGCTSEAPADKDHLSRDR